MEKFGKVVKTIIWLVVCAISMIVMALLWSKLMETALSSRMMTKFVCALFIVPAVAIYMAFLPWVKHDGVKGKILGGQLMALDEEGFFVEKTADLSLEDAKVLAKIFSGTAEYMEQCFYFDSYGIFLKTDKGGYWLFPGKTDKTQILTGEPGNILNIGLTLSDSQAETVQRILEKYL